MAQRVLNGAIRNAERILKVPITKSMRTKMKHAKSAYKLSLSTAEEAARNLEENNLKGKAAEINTTCTSVEGCESSIDEGYDLCYDTS